MGFSPLCSSIVLSPNCTIPRLYDFSRLTPHVIVGQCTSKQGASLPRFTVYNGQNGASCSYTIGTVGDITGCVDEANRPWTTSNRDNDHRAITFEIASDPKHPYAITDAAYNAMLDLMTDICRRHGKTKVLWLGTKEATLAYKVKKDEVVLTAHRWFAAKACPGDYLYQREGAIAEEVTRRLAQPIKTTDNKEEIDMNKEEMRALLVDLFSNELRPVLKEIVAEVYNELNPVYADIKDVPEYWRDVAQKLLDEESVNGGTAREICDTDVNLRAETLKAAVIALRYHEAAGQADREEVGQDEP